MILYTILLLALTTQIMMWAVPLIIGIINTLISTPPKLSKSSIFNLDFLTNFYLSIFNIINYFLPSGQKPESNQETQLESENIEQINPENQEVLDLINETDLPDEIIQDIEDQLENN